MSKLKITLLAATIAGGFALAGAVSAAPLTTAPIAAPSDLEQAQAKSKQTVRRKKARRYARHYGYYAPAYGYYGYPGYPYGYGRPYGYGPGLWLGAPGFGFGFGW